MANVKTVLDTRRAKSDGTFNIIYKIRHQNKVYTINTGVSVHELYWDSSQRKINKAHPNSKLLNIKLSKSFYKIEQAILLLDDDFTIDRLRAELSNKPEGKSSATFKEFSERLISQMMEVNRTGNAIVYQTSVNRFIAFSGEEIEFDKINYKLLEDFRHQLIVDGLKTNSISNYFRTIRAIYNKAIKHKIVGRDKYPFNDISIKSQRTANRAISKADIRRLISLSLEENSPSWKALNYFMLSFYLRGISFTDMIYLKPSDIINGRVHFKRRKTHKLYSIKLFSPAEVIINNLHQIDNNYLLPILPNDILEDSLEAKRIIKQWIKSTNKYLKRLGVDIGLDFALTTYSSRYGHANIAKQLGYSNELIAESLGHSYGNPTTNIYLDAFDVNKLDEMHYDVIFLDKV